MAKIDVTGKVTKIYAGKGFSIVEETQHNDKVYKNYFNVWTTNLAAITVGADVHVLGQPSASGYLAKDGTAKGSLNINFANVTTVEDDTF